MIDREGQRCLRTDESAECVCGHNLEHHYILDNGSGFCTHCAANDDNKFYHKFVSQLTQAYNRPSAR